MALYNGTRIFYQIERVIRGPLECPAKDCSEYAVILSSYPKSGNTWLRFVFSNVASIMEVGEQVDFMTIDNYAPSIRNNRCLVGMKKVGGLPVFLKSHSAYVSGFKSYKSVVIIRDPFKAISSYKDYLAKAQNRSIGGIDKFCRHWRYGFNAWAQFVASWAEHATILVKYEDLLVDPLGEVRRIYSTLGYDIDADVINKAIKLSSRNNMKKILEDKGESHSKNPFNFVREVSQNKGIREHFNDEELIRDFPFFIREAIKYGYMDKTHTGDTN